jgi:hypothetical protein
LSATLEQRSLTWTLREQTFSFQNVHIVQVSITGRGKRRIFHIPEHMSFFAGKIISTSAFPWRFWIIFSIRVILRWLKSERKKNGNQRIACPILFYTKNYLFVVHINPASNDDCGWIWYSKIFKPRHNLCLSNWSRCSMLV